VAPIEVFFGSAVFLFMLIGLVRGFLKELGVTTVMMFVLFFLSQFEPYLETGLSRALEVGAQYVAMDNRDLVKCWVFVLAVGGAAFISYEGETLGFGGQPPRGPQRIVLGGVTGLLNGYLIMGSVWYYMDKFNYPIAWLGFTADRLSPLAKGILPFLPIPFLGQPVLFGMSLLLYLSLLLILARVIR